MIIYFSEVAKEELEWGCELFCFNGKYYDFKLEFNGEDLVIADPIGRSLPLSTEAVPGLIKALKIISPYSSAITMGREAQELLESNKSICV